jgi:hypothetical protein
MSLVRSVAYGESEVKLFACKEIINQSISKGEKWYEGEQLKKIAKGYWSHLFSIEMFPYVYILILKKAKTLGRYA